MVVGWCSDMIGYCWASRGFGSGSMIGKRI
jgi:hypothetical protein